jgi:glutamyl-tRNA reductase
MAQLEAALHEAGAIVAQGLRRFDAVRQGRTTGPVIVQMHQRVEEAYRQSLRRLRPELVANGTLDQVARTLSRREVHRSIVEVREAAQRNDFDAIHLILRRVTEGTLPADVDVPLV